ncbi:MAG: site-specific integrase [Endomicrobiales bacterium]|nr:site-specific integrase [Endomicrobiales bacterium]
MSVLRTSNGTWAYDFWHDGRRYRKRYNTKNEAIQAEVQKRIKLSKRSVHDEKLTFKEAAKLFLENHSKPNKASYDQDIIQVRQLNELFGNKKLVDFTPLDIQNMRNHLMERGLCSGTADRYHSLVKVIFNKMIIWQKFEGFNPANGVKLKREPNAHIRFLSRDEIQVLEAYLRGTSIYVYFIGALHTGMRLGELCSVRWEDITLSIKDIFIPKSKSGKSRHIPMSEMLHDMLKKLYAERKSDKDFVFGTLYPNYVYQRFVKACKKLGIKNMRWHDLRHTFASQLVMKGVNIFQVSRWLGHSSVTTTEKYYAHLSPDNNREEINYLSKLSANSQEGLDKHRQTLGISEVLVNRKMN